jgi:phage terminase large subunit-like protein
MNSLSNSTASLAERLPSLEEVRAEIRRREALRNADAIRAAQAKRGGLIEFVRYFWPVLEPQTPLVEGWPLEAICRHLEAVTFGDVNRLLINVPPGFMKSLLCNVLFPAWEWGPMDRPHERYVTFSYSSTLTERDNGRFRALITSPEFRLLWGERFATEKVGETLVSNNKTGWKFASSVGGTGTGYRGSRVILDDPHAVKDAESELVRTGTVRWFQETMENRLNDLKADAIIVIMQRVHEADVSGAIIKEGGYVQLMIPMEFEANRACKTSIGWRDPRKEDGELAWPERFGDAVILPFKRRAFMWSGQYQQRPEPRGGGIFKRAWWKVWDDKTAEAHGCKPNHLPSFAYVLGILDTAYTEKEENDPCAMTVLGLWHDAKGNPQIMLANAWEEWLEFNPLIERTAKGCRDCKVDRLLIEAKANGISVAQEMSRRYSHSGWAVELVDPSAGDKVARAYAVTSFWEDGIIWVPGFTDAQGNVTGYRKFAERVVDQMAKFPRSTHKDLTDTMTMGVKYLRDIGLLLRTEEHSRNVTEMLTFRGRERPLYAG